MKRIFFFATPEDIKPVLSRFETNAPIKFVKTGTFSSPNLPIYLSASELPEPGIATDDTGSFSTTYLVSHRDLKNRVYAYKADTGQSLWLLSNGDNEETVLLTMGGLRNASTLLPGNMSTLHDTASAQQLMRWFLSSLKQMGFIKIEAWWLGREALAMLKAKSASRRSASNPHPTLI